MTKGDYVLATKFSDGDPQDHWCVGWYDHENNGRHIVVDSDGNRFRYSGFRRCSKIKPEVGKALMDNARLIELSNRSVWGWRKFWRELK